MSYPFSLGVSVTGIAPRFTPEILPDLERSRIATFELCPKLFEEDYSGRWRVEARDRLERRGKRFPTYHIPFYPVDDISSPDNAIRENAVHRLLHHLGEAAFFGCEILVVHPSRELAADEPHKIRIRQLRRSLQELEPILTAYHIRLALEWLPRHCLGNSLEELLTILADTGIDRYGVCLDVNHLMADSRRLPEYVERLGKRLFTLHLSDYDGIDEKHWMPGRGVVNWKEFLRSLIRIGYCGPFNYECGEPSTDPKNNVEEYERNFQSLMSACGY